MCFLCVCLVEVLFIYFFSFSVNPGGPAPTTPTISVCAALDTGLCVRAGCRYFDNDLPSNASLGKVTLGLINEFSNTLESDALSLPRVFFQRPNLITLSPKQVRAT